MVASCCAVNCTNRRTSDPKLTFHRFPRGPERRKQWILNMKRKNFNPSDTAVLCSAHFKEECFMRKGCTFLTHDAIPTIFTFPEHLLKKEKHRSTTNSNKPTASAAVLDLTVSTTSTKPTLTTAPIEVKSATMPDTIMINHQNFDYVHVEHSYYGHPESLKRKFFETIDHLDKTKKELRNAKDREKRAKTTIGALLEKVKLSESAAKMSCSFKDLPINIFKKPTKEYSEEQKQFASTLYFYGPKAYYFVREKLNLPHPSTIRRWLGCISSGPGLSEQVFAMLDVKRKDHPEKYSMCSVMIDGMSVRRHIDFDPKTSKMTGFVDLGAGPIENDASEAREAIVILAVGLQAHWKVPLGYFLIDGISADVQAQLVKSAISHLHEVDVRAVALVMDGHPTNQSMANLLGCSIKPDNLVSTFKHPENNNNIYVFFDACHLLKNFRGALHYLKELSESTIGTAKWEHIVKLQNLQSFEGLRAANKLTKSHVNFQNQKMKVSLAAQTLSSSVAKGLEFAQSIKCKGFADCDGDIADFTS